MKLSEELIVVEDQNKNLSSIVHYKKMMEEIFSNSHVDEKFKRNILISFSATKADNTVYGGITGWVGYDFALLEAIWVERSYQKMGLGKMLLNKLEKIARDNNCYRILTSTNNVSDSLGFWIKNGFELMHKVETKETGFTIYYFQKILSPDVK